MNELLGWYGYDNPDRRRDPLNKMTEPLKIMSFGSKESSSVNFGASNDNSMQSLSSRSSGNGKSSKYSEDDKSFLNASSEKSETPEVQISAEKKGSVFFSNLKNYCTIK